MRCRRRTLQEEFCQAHFARRPGLPCGTAPDYQRLWRAKAAASDPLGGYSQRSDAGSRPNPHHLVPSPIDRSLLLVGRLRGGAPEDRDFGRRSRLTASRRKLRLYSARRPVVSRTVSISISLYFQLHRFIYIATRSRPCTSWIIYWAVWDIQLSQVVEIEYFILGFPSANSPKYRGLLHRRFTPVACE